MTKLYLPPNEDSPYSDRIAYWESLVTDYRASNMKQRDFCDSRQIRFPQFRYWIRRLKKLKKQSSQSEPDDTIKFIPISLSDSQLPEKSEPLHIEYLWNHNKVSMDVQVSTKDIQQLIQRIGEWYAQL